MTANGLKTTAKAAATPCSRRKTKRKVAAKVEIIGLK
jgi:hypothetical protein